jgi:hypothetical protein
LAAVEVEEPGCVWMWSWSDMAGEVTALTLVGFHESLRVAVE